MFQVYRAQFDYDKTPLNAKVEWHGESAGEWAQEKVTFDAAYGSERMIAYLFLPSKARPPYQTVIYFPSAASRGQTSSKDLDKYFEYGNRLAFIVKNGRAVVYPI